ncbi:MAG: 4-(cytidine 5'-diphospho)-2-C-methyl-D-erythritol kinase [Angelakisella sp.]
MNAISINACAKLNLTMEVLGRREDGYHDIRSVMQFITLSDIVELAEDDKLSFWCDDESLCGEDNLAMKAYRLMENRFGAKPLSIRLYKNIPCMSGMGGGSADCAAVLAGINHMQQLGVSFKELAKASATLGADVPACLAGGTLIAEGIGERITQLAQKKPLHFNIIKPQVAFSTPEMYTKMDSTGGFAKAGGQQSMITAVTEGNAFTVAAGLYNSFEAVAQPYEEISKAKQILLKSGALGASMTGAGSAVFGIFADEATAKKAFTAIARKGVEVYRCQSV